MSLYCSFNREKTLQESISALVPIAIKGRSCLYLIRASSPTLTPLQMPTRKVHTLICSQEVKAAYRRSHIPALAAKLAVFRVEICSHKSSSIIVRFGGTGTPKLNRLIHKYHNHFTQRRLMIPFMGYSFHNEILCVIAENQANEKNSNSYPVIEITCKFHDMSQYEDSGCSVWL